MFPDDMKLPNCKILLVVASASWQTQLTDNSNIRFESQAQAKMLLLPGFRIQKRSVYFIRIIPCDAFWKVFLERLTGLSIKCWAYTHSIDGLRRLNQVETLNFVSFVFEVRRTIVTKVRPEFKPENFDIFVTRGQKKHICSLIQLWNTTYTILYKICKNFPKLASENIVRHATSTGWRHFDKIKF